MSEGVIPALISKDVAEVEEGNKTVPSELIVDGWNIFSRVKACNL
ncbi:hypothetical protein AB0758_44770 [Tolypothrix bouteillei VB521301_2]